MSTPREQKRLRALFCELVAPFLQPGRADTLYAYVTHKGGEKFERFISHGELAQLFALRERQQPVSGETPCLSGLMQWKQCRWSECDNPWGGTCVTIALDGSWLAIQQEDQEPQLYEPLTKP